MAEYIEREALKEHLKSYAGMFTDELGFVVNLRAVLEGVDFQTAADVVEVKHGRWEYNKDYEPFCTNCGEVADLDRYEYEVRGKVRWATTTYCPNCGARMDGGNE